MTRCGEQCSPVSLGQLRNDGARDKIDESASDVAVHGRVRGRLPVLNCGEQCSFVFLGQPTLEAGYTQEVQTDNVQGVVRYGKLAGEIDERASDVVVCGMVSDALLSLSASRW